VNPQLLIRAAEEADRQAVWAVPEPIVRAGETLALGRDAGEEDVLAYWIKPGQAIFVAELDGRVVGTYFLRANQQGGGDHVANAAYATDAALRGRGIARVMAEHSLVEAARRGFSAMQFNFVVSSNVAAVYLWQDLGFEIVGRLPAAFRHPDLGLVDALVMFRRL
jgi:ribosomal protein S18 acetylase RimI-like enzyme